MRTLVLYEKAEYEKMRHTILPLLHLGFPLLGSGLFLLYYRFTCWGSFSEISGYVQVLGITLPMVASIVCASSVELEEKQHFQTFLGTSFHRMTPFLAKWLALLLLELGALGMAVGIFGVGYHFLPGKEEISAGLYGKLILALWLNSFLPYLFHLYLNFRFGRTVSLCVGVGEFLLAALFLTGLGDGLWQFVPCTWSARWCSQLLGMENQFALAADAVCCLLFALAICGIIFYRMYFYEGRWCHD